MTTQLLVFDDDAATGRLVVRLASLCGLAAKAVTDTTAFEQSLMEGLPQIVALDLQLGGTDAVEQLRYLASQRFTGAVIIMSGFDGRVLEATASVGRNLGLNMAAALTKPIDVAALEVVLERLRAIPRPISADSLLDAIGNNELTLEFQPIVSRHPNTLKKLEALVRWNHPALGLVAPGDFLPVAEADKDVIDALTEWVIGAAVRAWKVLLDLGVSTPIAVNVSPLNLHDLAFPDRIARRLAAAGMPTEHLCLEITETAASSDPARMMDVLTRVRLKGMRLAIDDFGTGYSSLKALRQLPFSEIKIDQSFVSDMTTSSDSRAIVKAIVDLARNMEMAAVAEGVDTEMKARLLEEMNVDALQGFLIARSMPVQQVPTWLTAWLGGAPAPKDATARMVPAG
jgi:EAL domain-containing protein (putative c-di-GMP-specific phosphodiesterase class I)/ActR/RegA family two-component response regulator